MFLISTTFALVIGLYFARNNIVISIIVSLAYLLFVLWRFGKKRFAVCLALFGVGVLIPRIPLPSNNGPSFTGIVIDVRDNYYVFQSKFERYYVYSAENDFEIGDKLTLNGNVHDVKFETFESQFNFKEYLSNKGVEKELTGIFENT